MNFLGKSLGKVMVLNELRMRNTAADGMMSSSSVSQETVAALAS